MDLVLSIENPARRGPLLSCPTTNVRAAAAAVAAALFRRSASACRSPSAGLPPVGRQPRILERRRYHGLGYCRRRRRGVALRGRGRAALMKRRAPRKLFEWLALGALWAGVRPSLCGVLQRARPRDRFSASGSELAVTRCRSAGLVLRVLYDRGGKADRGGGNQTLVLDHDGARRRPKLPVAHGDMVARRQRWCLFFFTHLFGGSAGGRGQPRVQMGRQRRGPSAEQRISRTRLRVPPEPPRILLGRQGSRAASARCFGARQFADLSFGLEVAHIRAGSSITR